MSAGTTAPPETGSPAPPALAPPPLEQRLGGVAGRIKTTLQSLRQFRPADAAPQAQFDKLSDDLLDSLVEITAAAAVDERSIILAQDLSQRRKENDLAIRQQRDVADADIRSYALPFQKMLEAASRQ